MDGGGAGGVGAIAHVALCGATAPATLEALDALGAKIEPLNRRVEEEVAQRPAAVRLQTHPGVGPVTALAMVLTLGPAERFASGKQVASYFGLIPSEHSSGGRQQLGHISKQGSSFLRFLLVEAGRSAARYDAELGRFYRRLAGRKHRALAEWRWRASWR